MRRPVRALLDEAVQESEERFQLLVEDMPVMVHAYDTEWKLVLWNREAERVTGYTREEMIGNPNALDLLYPDPELRERLQADWSAWGNDYRDRDWVIRCKDGSAKTISWSNLSRRFPIHGWANWGIGVDVTERKVAEEAYRTVVERSMQGVVVLQEGGVVFANPIAEQVVGRSLGEIRAMPFDGVVALVAPEDRDAVRQRLLDRFAGESVQDRTDIRLVRKDGSVCWLAVHTSRIDYRGEPALHIAFIDITERKRAEERVARLNECFIGFGPDPTQNIQALVSLGGELLGACCALYNRIKGEMLHALAQWNTPPDFNPIDTPDGHICQDVIQRGGDRALVVRDLPATPYGQSDPNVLAYGLRTYIGQAVRCQGEYVGSVCAAWQEDFAPGEEDLRLLGILASAIGVEEERRVSAKALQESEENYRELVQSANSIILRMDTQGNVTFINEFAQRFFGYAESEILGRHVVGTILPLTDSARRELADMVRDIGRSPERYASSETESIRHDGERAWVTWTRRPIRDEQGRVTEILSVGTVTTERRRIEEELRRTIDELERFNRLGVDRELRMIELKREVNSMAQKAGEPAPYDLSALDGDEARGAA
jgi:PAS domain S-box-containing protein